MCTCSSNSVTLDLDESYNCTGFEIGRRYSYSVSGVNCGDQEGERSTFSIHPQGRLLYGGRESVSAPY